MEEASQEAKLKALLDALPQGVCFAGLTAAAIYGLPLPQGTKLDRVLDQEPIVAVSAGKAAIQRKEIRCMRLQFGLGDIVHWRGMPVTSPVRTWHDISRELDGPMLLAVTDVLLRRRISREELNQWNDRHQGSRGSLLRRRTVVWADPGAESPMESMLRWHLLAGGLPRPECNTTILIPDHSPIRVDLLYREAGLVVEYQGAYHFRDIRQAQRDEHRRRILEKAGFQVIAVVSQDLRAIEGVVAHVAQSIDQRAGYRLHGVLYRLKHEGECLVLTVFTGEQRSKPNTHRQRKDQCEASSAAAAAAPTIPAVLKSFAGTIGVLRESSGRNIS